MALLQEWQDYAEKQATTKEAAQAFWTDYFQKEREVYEKLLVETEPVSGTVQELADRYGMDLYRMTGSLLLGFMILPTVISVAEAAIRAVPRTYYEGGLALGASKERSLFFALLPGARSGILAGVVLGIGRAVGETMAVLMVVGNQARIPKSLLDGVRTLTTNIVLEMGYASGLHREALIATAVVLFLFILLINLSFSALKRRAGE